MSSMRAILERVLAQAGEVEARDEHLAEIARRTQAARAAGLPAKPERAFRHAVKRPASAPGSNHAPPLDETLIQEIARIGTAMYGEGWVAGVAADTGESVRQVRRWLAGTADPSPLDLRAVREAARRHIARIQRALGE